MISWDERTSASSAPGRPGTRSWSGGSASLGPGILSHAVGYSRVKNWRRSPAETILGVKNSDLSPRLWLETNNGLCTGCEHIALSGSPRARAFSWALMTLQVTQWTLASRLHWLNWEVSWAEAQSSDRFRGQREIPPRPSDCPCSTSLNHNAAPVAQTPAGAIPDWNLFESP